MKKEEASAMRSFAEMLHELADATPDAVEALQIAVFELTPEVLRKFRLTEDDVHEVTMAVFEKLSANDCAELRKPISNFKAWLRTVAANTWFDMLAKRQREYQKIRELGAPEEAHDPREEAGRTMDEIANEATARLTSILADTPAERMALRAYINANKDGAVAYQHAAQLLNKLAGGPSVTADEARELVKKAKRDLKRWWTLRVEAKDLSEYCARLLQSHFKEARFEFVPAQELEQLAAHVDRCASSLSDQERRSIRCWITGDKVRFHEQLAKDLGVSRGKALDLVKKAFVALTGVMEAQH
jgi:DNA-directed RNA polymerase specialized sigma24 family protein